MCGNLQYYPCKAAYVLIKLASEAKTQEGQVTGQISCLTN